MLNRARLARMLPLFIAGATREQIAAATGYSRRQVERASQAPEIREAVEAAEHAAYVAGEKLLHASTSTAIAALLDVAADPKAKAEARVKAGVAILDRAKLGPTKRLEHTGAGGGAIRTETAILEGQPVTKKEVAAQARALAETLEAELAAEAEAGALEAGGEGYELPATLEGDDEEDGDADRS